MNIINYRKNCIINKSSLNNYLKNIMWSAQGFSPAWLGGTVLVAAR